MADYQTLLGLALNLGGAIAVAFSRAVVAGTAEPTAGVPSSPDTYCRG